MSDPVLVALIGAFVTLAGLVLESGRRTRRAATGARETADATATAIGTPNGGGNVVKMSEKSLKQLEQVLTELTGLRSEVQQVRLTAGDVVRGQAGQDRRLAAGEQRQLQLLEQQARTALCVNEVVARVEQLEQKEP